MKGRRPKPTAMKIANNNPGKRPLNKKEPKPGKEAPMCPDHLDAEARREWFRIVPQLQAMNLAFRVDSAALAVYCQAYSRWTAAEIKIGADLIVKVNGTPQPNPYLSISNRAVEIMRKFLVEFGLTPASRSRLTVSSSESEDEFEGFLGGKAG